METVKASVMYTGPEKDVLTLFVEPTPDLWQADPIDDDIAILRALDEREQETGDIAGVEIIDFSKFDRWDDLPVLPLLWKLNANEPLPLAELLKEVQRSLRGEKVVSK